MAAGRLRWAAWQPSRRAPERRRWRRANGQADAEAVIRRAAGADEIQRIGRNAVCGEPLQGIEIPRVEDAPLLEDGCGVAVMGFIDAAAAVAGHGCLSLGPVRSR